MRGYRTTLFIVLFSIAGFAGTQFKPTTTLTAETSNNTSAADTFTAQTNGNLGAGNVSKVPMRSLLYPGSTAKIYAHFMPWFGFGSHMSVGYTSNDSVQVQKQVTDMISRGFDGMIIDWYGQGAVTREFSFYDQAVQEIMQQAQLSTGFSFAVMDDAGSIKSCAGTTGCDVSQTVISDLTYAYNTYENSPSYMRYNNQPVVFFFGMEDYAVDWNRVRAGVPGNPVFIFRNAGGFNYLQSNGAFAWVEPETATATDPMALNYMDNYDRTAMSMAPAYSLVSGYKGFNDTLAAWGAGRIVDQQCGQTWLKSVAESAKFYSTTQQMGGIQLVTWNDYEEATEIESGVDNCVTVSASATGQVLSWSITGQANTLDHFTVFVSQDGANLMALTDVPATATSLDLTPFGLPGGTYIAYVKAVGKPSMANHMSGSVSITVTETAPNQPPVAALSLSASSGYGPLTVTASTAGSFDPDGTVASSSISFGDGSSAAGPNAAHTYATAGSYVVTATVTDNQGASSSTTAVVTVKTPEVIVTSPAPGATGSSIHVVATGFSGYPVVAMQVYMDGGLIYQVNSPNLDTTLILSAGAHLMAVKEWDNSGSAFMKTMNVTGVNQPPVAAISTNTSSILVGGSITASTAGSFDPDGTIVSTSISFGDGTIVASANATHQYTATGTYTVTATVTDNSGASSTASTTVTVGKRFVTITSPTAGTVTTSSVQVAGSSHSGYPIVATQIYLDNVLVYQTSNNSVNVPLSISTGSHLICVQGWDSTGATFKAFVTVTR